MGEILSSEETLYITFRSEEEIVRFVEICCGYDDAIDVRVDRMNTDAKSMLGMLLMKLGQPLEIQYDCYDDENNYPAFRRQIMEQFDVKAQPGKKSAKTDAEL